MSPEPPLPEEASSLDILRLEAALLVEVPMELTASLCCHNGTEGVALDEGQTGLYPSTAIDSNDKLHISYYDESLGELKYATNNSGAWVVSVIDSQGGSEGVHAMSSSIAIDSNDNIHISYPFLDVNVAGSYGLKYVALCSAN